MIQNIISSQGHGQTVKLDTENATKEISGA